MNLWGNGDWKRRYRYRQYDWMLDAACWIAILTFAAIGVTATVCFGVAMFRSCFGV